MGYYSKAAQRVIDLAKKKMRLSVVTRDGFPENEVIKEEARELMFEVVQGTKTALVVAPSAVDETSIANPQHDALDQLLMDPLLDNIVKIVSIVCSSLYYYRC
jgi:hypothetical protein